MDIVGRNSDPVELSARSMLVASDRVRKRLNRKYSDVAQFGRCRMETHLAQFKPHLDGYTHPHLIRRHAEFALCQEQERC